MKNLLYLLTLSLFISIYSCKEETVPSNDQDNVDPTDTAGQNNTDPQTKTKTEMLAKVWIVDEAYVNGTTPDNSSKGLKLDIKSDGNYTLINTGYQGTWEFEENESKINFDKSKQEYNQVFTLNEFTDTKLDATFISAFTGQDARWIMVPFE